MVPLFADIGFTDLYLLLKEYGPLVLIVAFLLWEGWTRENRLNNRIDHLEDEQRKVLLPMVERCTDVISQNTAMMERLEKSLDERFECPLKSKAKCPQQG